MSDKPNERQRRNARGDQRGTLLDSLPRMPLPANDPGRSGSAPRRRAPDAARSGEIETPHRFTRPSMPRWKAERPAPRRDWDEYAEYDEAYAEADPDDLPTAAAPGPYASAPRHYAGASYASAHDQYDEYGDGNDYQDERPPYETRARERSLARPLTPA
ncbi:MAG TPA: hypothetical protein VF725_15320, partial [Ktedonobacterales bacterium]